MANNLQPVEDDAALYDAAYGNKSAPAAGTPAPQAPAADPNSDEGLYDAAYGPDTPGTTVPEVVVTARRLQKPEDLSIPAVLGGAAQNFLPNLKSTASGIFDALTHPVRTLTQTGQVIGGAADEASDSLLGLAGVHNTTPVFDHGAFDNLKAIYADHYGSLQRFATTLKHEPVSVLGDALGLAGGVGAAGDVASLASRVGALGEAGQVVGNAGRSLSDLAAIPAKVATAPMTMAGQGLGALADATGVSRVPGAVGDIVQDRLANLSGTGQDIGATDNVFNKPGDNLRAVAGLPEAMKPVFRQAQAGQIALPQVVNDIADDVNNRVASWQANNPFANKQMDTFGRVSKAFHDGLSPSSIDPTDLAQATAGQVSDGVVEPVRKLVTMVQNEPRLQTPKNMGILQKKFDQIGQNIDPDSADGIFLNKMKGAVNDAVEQDAPEYNEFQRQGEDLTTRLRRRLKMLCGLGGRRLQS